MTQTSTASAQLDLSGLFSGHTWGVVLGAVALIALYWGGPVLAIALAVAAWKRSKTRYHVGSLRAGVPVQTYRTKAQARKASIELYREHGRAFRITATR
jgi:hypothetical protein